MVQPQMAPITCSQCNVVYNSEHELRDHLRTVHREICSEESLPPSSVPAEQENEIDRFRERTSTGQHEGYSEPGEENEVGGEA
jgi:hypothetical protein